MPYFLPVLFLDDQLLFARYFVGGGRTIGGRQMRGGRRLHKKASSWSLCMRYDLIALHAAITLGFICRAGLMHRVDRVPNPACYYHDRRNRDKRGSGRGAKSGDNGFISLRARDESYVGLVRFPSNLQAPLLVSRLLRIVRRHRIALFTQGEDRSRSPFFR